jgi:hypothetical protein
VAVEPDDHTLDWDAAFEALVAPLRPPRYLQVARIAGQALVAGALMFLAAWMLIHLVADPLGDLGRPWR